MRGHSNARSEIHQQGGCGSPKGDQLEMGVATLPPPVGEAATTHAGGGRMMVSDEEDSWSEPDVSASR